MNHKSDRTYLPLEACSNQSEDGLKVDMLPSFVFSGTYMPKD
ncbi:MAG: hypothetical protein ACFFC7_08060 [Candidatus Hermodarchaeota archaeon]